MSFILLASLGTAYAFASGFDTKEEIRGLLHFPVSRKAALYDAGIRSDNVLQRRSDNGFMVETSEYNTTYTIDLRLGTPPQHVSVILDTLTSESWVPAPGSCETSNCTEGSTFDEANSSSFRKTGIPLSLQYADLTTVVGSWARDDLLIGTESVKEFTFGVADETNSSIGSLGLGYGTATANSNVLNQTALNFPQQLKSKGVIDHASYSLWLNHDDGDAGSITFGAIDHTKYLSDLNIIPFLRPGNDTYLNNLAVHLSGLSVYDSHANEQPIAACALPAILAPGVAFSSLPYSIAWPLLKSLNAVEFYNGLFLADCDSLNSADGGLGLQIGGIDITVGFSDLFIPYGRSRDTGKLYCIPGFTTQDGYYSYALLGDNILKNFYLVYDLENYEIGIADARAGNGANRSMDLEPLSTGIPGSRRSHNGNLTHTMTATDITLPGLVPSHSSSTTSSSRSHSSAALSIPSSVQETIVIGAKPTISVNSDRKIAEIQLPSSVARSSDGTEKMSCYGCHRSGSQQLSLNMAAPLPIFLSLIITITISELL